VSDTQDRDQQILNRLGKIEHRVDSIDQTSAFALRAEEEKHLQVVRGIFGSSKRRAQVYLAANGHRGVQEIAQHLGMKRQNVGSDLNVLYTEGLLELGDSVGGRDIWAKKALDRTLQITKFLQKEFGLARDGKADSKAKNRSPKKKPKAKRKRRTK
jgi:DNA-binding transcriptional ArsR family regulator